MSRSAVELFWLPLGAGGDRCVQIGGRTFESVVAARQGRRPEALYHAALQVVLDGQRHTIEMAPAWRTLRPERGVVGEGPVGARWLGRSRWFRYELRCWRDGVIPDLDEAVGGGRVLSNDRDRAARVLALVRQVPLATWGRDELHAGEMWNSN